MNTIAIVTRIKNHAEFLRNDLYQYFKEYATINVYGVDEIENMEVINEECIIISSFDIFQRVKKKARVDAEIIINKLTTERRNLIELDSLPKKSKVLVVNVNYMLCMEVISLLYAYGYKDYEYNLFYEGIENYDTGIEIAITPNEVHLVPESIKKIINIGDRVCSLSAILEIADALKIDNFTEHKQIKKLLNNMETTADYSIASILGEKNDLEVQINTILELMEQGIIITDVSGIILSCNSKAQHLLKSRTNHLEGFNVSQILPELDNIKNINLINKKEEKILNINNDQIISTFIPIINNTIINGFIITLVNFEETEDKQNIIRTKISLGSHRAKYTFDDVKGKNILMEKTIKTAKSMANSNSSIIIYGESGTGKEVFAQSIHNLSPRKKNNFVAVNCAAIPETLLESEMFGYEEGAFTGAKKGGKIGYFELAHNGTLFLDEISELPLLMQPKLLRAIEDMSIIKIGSNKIISINIRIIAATNKSLLKLVQEGKFREDLYYRLNVLPLNIPSLRERREDIMLIADHFAKSMNMNIHFTQEAEKAMQLYNWKGNIRELRNVMEYIKSLDKQLIEKEDLPLPANIDLASSPIQQNNYTINNDIIIQFILREGRKIHLYKDILSELEKAYNKKERIGRSKLMNIFDENNLFYSEQEIRTCLLKLNNYGFINSDKGSGSVIAPSGVMLKNKIIDLIS